METTPITVNADSLPIECRRQAGETQKNFSAFILYLTLGRQRSLNAAAKHLDIPKRNLEALSKKYSWAARSTAYDDWIAAEILKRNAEDEINEMRGRHASQARAWLSILSRVEHAWIERSQEDQNVLKSLPLFQHLEIINRMGSILPKLQEAEAAARGASYKNNAATTTDERAATAAPRLMPPVIVQPAANPNNENDA
ncbi:MAG: hypothetical protein JNL32_09625 [Candidatus Kapabacteria bacterium]|nr:hypothetical protein [Candidatus Kapabacteria bacterium]